MTTAATATSGVIRSWSQALTALATETVLALDTETTGLKPRVAKMAVLSLYGADTDTVAVLHVRGQLPDEVRRWLSAYSGTLITHNGTNFDLPLLMQYGVDIHNATHYDTLIGESIVIGHARQNVKRSLAASLTRRIGVRTKEELKSRISHDHWMDTTLTDDQLAYCIADIVYLPRLMQEQCEKARTSGQVAAMQLEMSIIPAVAQIVYNGVPIDVQRLAAYTSRAERDALRNQLMLETAFGAINLNSPQQVIDAFSAYGFDLQSTAARYLEELSNGSDEYLRVELQIDTDFAAFRSYVKTLLAYRHAVKRAGMFSDKWAEKYITFHPDTNYNYVHSSLWAMGTDTGRFASSDINQQNLPRDTRASEKDGGMPLFGGLPGYKVVSADYQQLEILCAAQYYQDGRLIQTIKSGTDIHTNMARVIFRTDNITKRLRQLAKAISFCLFFGGGAETLVTYAHSYGVTLTLEEAKKVKADFLRLFPTVALIQRRAFDTANRGKRVIAIELPHGLRRLLTGNEISGTRMLNTAIQGMAAGGMKYAIREAYKHGLTDYLAATVHDELVAVCPENIAGDVAKSLSTAMIDGMQQLVSVCPVNVDVTTDDYWI